MKEIGKELRKYIKKNNYENEKDFAKKMNITPSTLSKYILNQRQIPLDTLTAFAKELGFSIDYLCEIKNPQFDENGSYLLNQREEELITLLQDLPIDVYDSVIELMITMLKNMNKVE